MLSNSTRSLPKVTYVTLRPERSRDNELGSAVLKSGFTRQLNLQKGEVDAVFQQMSKLQEQSTSDQHAFSHEKEMRPLLQQLEMAYSPSEMPSAADFASIPTSQFVAFGHILTSLRQRNAHRARGETKKEDSKPLQLESAGAASFTSSTQVRVELGKLTNLANIAAGATSNLINRLNASPIGILNLERIEMTPAGLEKGELIATVPLAPMEKTTVVQQEWSVVSQEFTSIVTDELENFSEKGVTENSELAQATTSQTAHSNQFNITASASGGCGFVSGSVSSGFQSQDQNSQSANDSRKHAQSTTQKASSRAKQSHKVTISSTTVTGSSTTTARTLENASTTKPMRIDYFSMMRKWHVGLYRYGLRLTYDITVPEPGAALRAAHRDLALLVDQAAQSFTFNVALTDITPDTYPKYIAQYGAQMPAAPKPATITQPAGGTIEHAAIEGSAFLGMNTIPVEVREDYEVDTVDLDLELGNMFDPNGRRFDVVGSTTDTWLHMSTAQHQVDDNQRHHFQALAGPNGPFMHGETGNQTISYVVGNTTAGIANFVLNLKLTQEYKDSWTLSVWNLLYNAAQTAFYTEQSKVQERISNLQAKINNVDTLTLRREENEEIMKCALRWLLGPRFEFVPQDVITYITSSNTPQEAADNIKYGVNFTGNSISSDTASWTVLTQYESLVNFINEAIEWENVIYFLYSYFWDIPNSWSFIRQLDHPDATRQAFLRAGASRIVLTVRQGYETAWTWFVDQFDLDPPDGPWPDHPYMTIAQQIRDYDNTNYPGIPAANPANGPSGGGPDDGTPAAGTICSATIIPSTSATDQTVKIPVASSKGFVVGASAIIDHWDAKDPDTEQSIQERQTITAVPDEKHIVVERLMNAHFGTTRGGGAPFPVLQAAAKGLLVAEWFEYTPSKGTFIDVDSNLTSIA